MTERYLFTSLTRIADLARLPFGVEPLGQDEWATGDYVLGEVLRLSRGQQIELATGRMLEIAQGDLIVGAFGKRHATLELVGDWRRIGANGAMDLLTGGGLLGRCTSKSTLFLKPPHLRYQGHIVLDGRKSCMGDWVEPVPERKYGIPSILCFGTSMSAGKTTAARIIIRQLTAMGLRVIGAKVTGAGRYRDVLAMADAGAEFIIDFSDVGLPSTVCPEEVYRPALTQMLSRMAAVDAEVAVIEVGASPVEPYNGQLAIEALRDSVRLNVLCATDPYAVVGVIEAFGIEPDLVTGIASNTEAGVELIQRISGVRALNVMRKRAMPSLRAILKRSLDLG